MALKEQISQDLKDALKGKEEVAVSTLRLLIAAFNNMEIEKRVGGEVTEDNYIEVVKKEAKKRKEAIEGFQNAGRVESVRREEAEMKILEAYLPEMMSEAEVTKLVEEEIASNPDANAGQIVGAVMRRAAGNVDGGVVSQIVQSKLSQSE